MSQKKAKQRVDLLLAQKGLAESRKQAQALIMEGVVYCGVERVLKPGQLVDVDMPLEVRSGLPYVSRGGLKLAHALDRFGLEVSGMVVLDVGASTGGFTDCMLQRGVPRVYAVDVGQGQLHYRLRQDPRVVEMEGVNARYDYLLPETVDLATVDVSFISATKVVPTVAQHLRDGGFIFVLVKPQFEAQRKEVGRGGLIKDPLVHARVLGRMVVWAVDAGYRVRGLVPSPILGDAGNREFFLVLQPSPLHA